MMLLWHHCDQLSIFFPTEGRHLQDTENRLRANISEQKQLTEAALHADLDSKAKQMDGKMQVSDWLKDKFKFKMLFCCHNPC